MFKYAYCVNVGLKYISTKQNIFRYKSYNKQRSNFKMNSNKSSNRMSLDMFKLISTLSFSYSVKFPEIIAFLLLKTCKTYLHTFMLLILKIIRPNLFIKIKQIIFGKVETARPSSLKSVLPKPVFCYCVIVTIIEGIKTPKSWRKQIFKNIPNVNISFCITPLSSPDICCLGFAIRQN